MFKQVLSTANPRLQPDEDGVFRLQRYITPLSLSYCLDVRLDNDDYHDHMMDNDDYHDHHHMMDNDDYHDHII